MTRELSHAPSARELEADAQEEEAAIAAGIEPPVRLRLPGEAAELRLYELSNGSAMVWDPVTGPADTHDKRQLVPFGEYLTMRPLVSAVVPSAARRCGSVTVTRVPRPGADSMLRRPRACSLRSRMV